MIQPAKIFVCLMSIVTIIILSACDRDNPEKRKLHFSKQGIYELDMRVYMKELSYTASEGESLIRQWKLNIPKSFISKGRMVFGINGKPNYDPIKDKSNKYKINLSAAVDVENKKIVENASYGRKTPGEKRILIALSNGKLRMRDWKKLDDKEKCYTDEEYSKLFRNGRYFACTSTTCRLTMYVDGWVVRLNLDKELYEEGPQPYCDMTREFLDEMTLKRDVIF